MFLLDCLLLAVFVYVLPGLAVFPRLILSPQFIFGLPVISAGVIYLVVTLLKTFHIYHHTSVLIAAFCLAGVAILRLLKTIQTQSFSWTGQDRWLWLFIGCLMMPYFIKLGTQAFEQGDEIYSWNFWGLQHYFQEPIDFSHTSATYPQLFPKLISFCYHLLGSTQLQCPVKAMLGMFPLAMIGAWASMMMKLTPRRWIYFLLTVGYVVGGIKLEQFFNDGYADPIMTSALVVSMAYFLLAISKLNDTVSHSSLVWMAVLAGTVACFTKQPALMWLIVILPTLLTAQAFHHKKLWMVASALACVALALTWMMTEGHQFYQNQGVIYLSFEGRGWVEQFFHVANRYLIQKPLLLILLVLTGFMAHANRTTRFMFWAFILPQLVLWLMFGAYQLRLGQHVIAAATLILLFGLRDRTYSISLFKHLQRSLVKHRNYWRTSMVSLCVLACVGLLGKAWYFEKPGVDFRQGGRVSLVRYFGQDAQKVYDEIYQNPNALLWVPTRYIYGIFYKQTELTSPDYQQYTPYDERALVTELRHKKPDYVFTVSSEVIDGPASQILESIIGQCPSSFEVFAKPPNKYNYVTYKVYKQKLLSDPCLAHLERSDPARA